MNPYLLRASFVLATCVLCFGCAEDASEPYETVQQAARGGQPRVTLCHVPPGNPAAEHTITVGAPAVDAHLAHGDYLGECNGCPATCDALASEVREICESFGPIPGAPDDFCATAEAVVADACLAECPGPEPDTCREYCDGLAITALEACFELGVDPGICDLGAGTVFEACVEIYECPPPPLPCDQQCVETANAMMDGCLADPPDVLVCAESGDPVLQTCLIDAQAYLNDCLFAEDGCFPPAGDCFSGCQTVGNDAFLECISEPVCGAPDDCFVEADDAARECFDGCCVSDCIEFECVPACGDDTACLDTCASDVCVPACEPPPPCEFTCPDGSCVPDPALCEPATCEDECFSIFDECLAAGEDPFLCEHFVDDCLFGCAPPPCPYVCPDGSCVDDPAFCPALTCEDRCFITFDDCLASGADPLLCEENVEACLGGCEPGLCTDYICPDGSCVPDPSWCSGGPTCDSAFDVVDCFGLCVSAELLGNGVCDPMLDCYELDWDLGDCSTAP